MGSQRAVREAAVSWPLPPAPRQEVKAIHWPSGDHVGFPKSLPEDVEGVGEGGPGVGRGTLGPEEGRHLVPAQGAGAGPSQEGQQGHLPPLDRTPGQGPRGAREGGSSQELQRDGTHD